jgi:predicted methyltransferase
MRAQGAHILSTGQAFEPATLALMLAYAQPGTTVVDAGCNFGSYSVFFAAKVGPTGRVHCFEPQKKMAQVGAGCSARARSKRARCSRFLH